MWDINIEVGFLSLRGLRGRGGGGITSDLTAAIYINLSVWDINIEVRLVSLRGVEREGEGELPLT